MVLSATYCLRLSLGWVVAGLGLLAIAQAYIGGAGTFFILAGVACFTIFPLLHFSIAALAARKLRKDPTFLLSLGIVAGVAITLAVFLASGLFNYV